MRCFRLICARDARPTATRGRFTATSLFLVLAFSACTSRVGAGQGEACGDTQCASGLTCASADGTDYRCRMPCETRADCWAGLDCSERLVGPDGLRLGIGVCYARGSTAAGERCARTEECADFALCTEQYVEPRCVAACTSDAECPLGVRCVAFSADARYCLPDCTTSGPTSCDDRALPMLCVPWFDACLWERVAAECYSLEASDRVCPLGTICWLDGACVTEDEAQTIWAEMMPP